MSILPTGASFFGTALTHLGAPIGISPLIKGDIFSTVYSTHLHGSSVGPTSPPTNAAQFLTCLSTKVLII